MTENLHDADGGASAGARVRSAGARTVHRLGGAAVQVVLGAADTDGAYTLLEYDAPSPYQGPPPHRHTRLAEHFHVLSGRLDVTLGDTRMTLLPGDVAFVPPGVVHTFANPHPIPCRFLVQVTPGGFEGYFAELVELVRGAPAWPPADDVTRAALASLAARYDTIV